MLFILGLIIGFILRPIFIKVLSFHFSLKRYMIDKQIKEEFKKTDNLIASIKLYRNLTGKGLKESKEYVEKLVNYTYYSGQLRKIK